jgi:hypothetical protein
MNGTATLTVTVSDGQPQNGTFSRTFTVTVTAVPPAPPSGVVVFRRSGGALLRWHRNTEADLAAYVIYKTQSAGVTPGDSVARVSQTDTTYTRTGLINGTTYYYRITAVDSAGNTSGVSQQVSVIPHEAKITEMWVANSTFSSVTIAWVTDIDVDGWVEYGTTAGLGLSVSEPRGERQLHVVDIKGLPERKSYRFQVVSGGIIDDNRGNLYTFTTASSQQAPSRPSLFGTIYERDGTTPAAGALVLVSVMHSGVESLPLLTQAGASTEPGYNWIASLVKLRHPATGAPFPIEVGDEIHLTIQGGSRGEIMDWAKRILRLDISQDMGSYIFKSVIPVSVALQQGWNLIAW